MKLYWQFVEGKFLLLQLAVMLMLAGAGCWLWYRIIYAYVPAAGEKYRCLTGIGAGIFVLILAEAYSIYFAIWQLVLLRRRWEGEIGWEGTTWVVLVLALLPAWLILNAIS